MKSIGFLQSRRSLLKAGSAFALGPLVSRIAWAETVPQLRLQGGSVDLDSPAQAVAVGLFDGSNDALALRLQPGQRTIPITNQIAVPVLLRSRGADGLQTSLIAPGAKATFNLPSTQSGTFLLDPRLQSDGSEVPLLPLLVIADDPQSPRADRDQIVLIEDWRIGPGHKAQIAGRDAADAKPLYTVNRKPSLDINVHANERVRLRIANGCQRNVVALKFTDYDVQIIEIDSKPAEPFVAREGQIILPPGSRVDALLDAAQPINTISSILLHDGTKPMPIGRVVVSGEKPVRDKPLALLAPSSPNASRIDLKAATRVALSLEPNQWSKDASAKTAAAFRVARGRTVVLAVTNPATSAATFSMSGHHFRLLDRLDDGWKPFWLDTLAFNPGQTQRLAFAAEHSGSWLMETMGVAWSSPRLFQTYEVT